MNDAMVPLKAIDAGGAARIASEVQRIQGAIISAKNFPRDSGAALKKIEQSCARPKLAEAGMYSYVRGGQNITGPSIRLAEVIIQNWGNAQFGFREIAREQNMSTVYCYCVDLETNVTRDVEFRLALVRDTKKETYVLTTERDIYELIANQASRRVRACILALVPGDIVEAAVEACEKTLENEGKTSEKRQAAVAAFQVLGVGVDQIEKRLGHRITALSQIEYVQLKKIYQSIRDGMSEVVDWFEPLLDPGKIKREQDAAAAAPPPPPTPSQQEHVKKELDADRVNAKEALRKVWNAVKDQIADPRAVLGIGPDMDIDSQSADQIWEFEAHLLAWLDDIKGNQKK